MARVHRVQRSNKEHTCGHSPTHVIPKGDPYLWAKPGFRTRTPKVRCVEHPFRPSELATGLNAEPMAAQEDFDATLGTLERHDYDGLAAAVDEFRDALESYRDARQEALDAWENGNSQFEEWLEEAEEALSALEDLEVEEWDEEEPSSETADPEPDAADFETEEDYNEAVERWQESQDEAESEWDDWDARRDQHWDDQIDAASEASASVSL